MATLSNKPTHVPDCGQTMLNNLYDEHGFDSIISQCEPEPIIPYRRRKPEDTFHSDLAEFEKGTRFRDRATRHTIATIFWYTDMFNNTRRIIRSLRVGDTVYDARV
jgi:hypothetical protein